MNLRKVDLNLLTVFDAVMREGNFTRAADKIGMTQPAVSEAVARLRHLFKDDLWLYAVLCGTPLPHFADAGLKG